jgi:putative membrane protein
MGLILTWLVLSFAVWVTDALLPGFHLKSGKSALLIAAIFGLLNLFIGWIFWFVFGVATLGIAWLLAALTRVIVNAILLVITDKLTDHLKIDGFGWALAGALIMAIAGTFGEWVVRGIFN